MSMLESRNPYIPPGIPCNRPPALTPSPTQRITSPLCPGLSLVPLEKSHTESLYANLCTTPENNEKIWLYIPRGPFHTLAEFSSFIDSAIPTEDNVSANEYITYAIISSSDGHVSNQGREKSGGTAIGLIRYLNIRRAHLSLEIGMVLFPLTLQRTRESTLTFYLLIDHAVRNLSYERIEWKANVLNTPSVKCALRLGFKYEGLFRRHWVVKGVWRDTWWASLLADEWTGEDADADDKGKMAKGLGRVVEEWLEEGNFDSEGRQRKRLEEFREEMND